MFDGLNKTVSVQVTVYVHCMEQLFYRLEYCDSDCRKRYDVREKLTAFKCYMIEQVRRYMNAFDWFVRSKELCFLFFYSEGFTYTIATAMLREKRKRPLKLCNLQKKTHIQYTNNRSSWRNLYTTQKAPVAYI